MTIMETTYTNPIIPGFAPDPTIIHVDGIYYLSNSSFHIFPGLPIYVSKNLKSWTQIGNAINRSEQLVLKDAICMNAPDDTGRMCIGSMGLLAPTLRHNKGIFYMICTNLSMTSAGFKPMNFYVTSKDIWSDVWSDPIYYEWNGIDPSFFFDDDDRVYIQGQAVIGNRSKQPTGHVKQCEIDIKTGKLIGEPQVIWGGWSQHDTEGPHVYKRGGWYYCLVAEGGTFEDHILSIGRSRDVWGPYESCPHNPVLTAKGTDNYVQNTGHGDIFEDAQGLWWSAVLGIRRGPGGRYPLSRETFLTPVHWTEDGWPTFAQPSASMERVDSKVLSLDALEYKTQPDTELVYVRDRSVDSYKIRDDGRSATITSSKENFTVSTGTFTFLGKRQQNLASLVSCTLVVSSSLTGKDLECGLAVYKDEFRFAQICYSYQSKEILFCYQQQDPVKLIRIKTVVDIGKSIEFRILSSELKYVFSFRSIGAKWIAAGELDSLEMTARDFTGTIFGIFATGEAGFDQIFEDINL